MSKKKINIIKNSNKYSIEIADRLKEELEKYDFIPTYDYSEEAVLNISIGGDGSFLKSVRDNNFPEIPYIGLNTGTLGFYPELSPEDIEFFVREYNQGNYTLNKLNLLKGEIQSKDSKEEIYAINDIAIKNMILHTKSVINANLAQNIREAFQ